MPNIKLKNVTKKFRSISGKEKDEIITAVDNVSVEIKAHSYNTVLGPSGCGKTTLLRMIAGLEMPTKGKIFFNGKNVTNLPPEEKNIGFVFQHYSLFPHMDVWHNVGYGPLVRNFPKEKADKFVYKVLKMVKLDDRFNAYPKELSGGMKQRTAVARALAVRAKLLLLDEPLGALDARIGTALRYELMNLVKKYKLTAIHVTHNQEEAMTISDNIIMMKRGRIIQTGSPKEIYRKPNSIFSAYFLGRCNFFRCDVVDKNHVKFRNTIVEIPKSVEKRRVILGVRPEKIHINSKVREENIQGAIESINFLGDRWQYRIKLFDGTKVSALKRSEVKFGIGDKVSMNFYTDNILMFDEPENFEKERSV
ncbi:MAG: ABC transporter ATP-binding protein [Patescibacteria group bacterium]|nr:ABC transporter ATP-binding protein [Patescibacteria group bacterium]